MGRKVKNGAFQVSRVLCVVTCPSGGSLHRLINIYSTLKEEEEEEEKTLR